MAFFFAMLFMACVFWRPQVWLFHFLYGSGYLDVVVALTVFALMVEYDEGRLKPPKRHQIVLLVGLYLGTLLSHVANTYLHGLMKTVPATFKYMFYAIMLLSVLDRVKRLRIVIVIFVVMGLVMCYHAYLQVTAGGGFMNQPPVVLGWKRGEYLVRTRFFGIFGDPNDLAQMLVICIPMVFAVFWRMNFLKFVLCCAAVYAMVWTVDSTGSRGGLVGLAAIAGTSIVFLMPRRWTPALLLCAVIVALTLCPAAGLVLDSSARTRVIYWGLANWQFKQKPLFGLGFNMFWQVTHEGQAAHNSFVHCYTELGYFGYWFWFGIILVSIVSAWRARVAIIEKVGPEVRYLGRASAACIISMVGYCASSYFLSRAFIYPYFFLCVLMMAFANVSEEYMDEDELPIVHPWRDVFVLTTVGSLASITYIYWSIILLNEAL